MVNKFTNIKERVMMIANRQSMTKEKFFESIGMKSASFRGKAKDSPLNSNAIANIITKYPDVDIRWLLLGAEKSPVEIEIHDPREIYGNEKTSCDEKDEIIAVLKSQIDDLKLDKKDLMELLKSMQKK